MINVKLFVDAGAIVNALSSDVGACVVVQIHIPPRRAETCKFNRKARSGENAIGIAA